MTDTESQIAPSEPILTRDPAALPEELPRGAQIPEDLDPLADGILMQHQKDWLEDQSDLKLAEKGRRTGITFAEALDVPILANITEFGATPLYNRKELGEAGADMVLYPLSAFRAMNKAALTVYQNILDKGDQKDVVDLMQTRMELYDFLNYHEFEQKLDQLFQQQKN